MLAPKTGYCSRLFLASALSVALLGCQTSPTQIEQVHSRRADVVRLSDICPATEERPPEPPPGVAFPPLVIPLAVAVAPVVAQVVVDGTVKLLEQQKANRNFTTVAQGSGTLLKTDGGAPKIENTCLVVMRGTLGPWDSRLPTTKGTLKGNEMKKLGLATYPDLYFEAKLTLAENSSTSGKLSLRVEPRIIHFAHSGAKSVGSGKKSIGLLLVLSKAVIREKDQKTFDSANAVVPLLFKDARIGSEIVAGNGISRELLFQDQIVAIELDKEVALKPSGEFNLYTIINETEEPRFFEEVAVKAVSDNKDQLKKALTSVITDAIKNSEVSSEQKTPKS